MLDKYLDLKLVPFVHIRNVSGLRLTENLAIGVTANISKRIKYQRQQQT